MAANVALISALMPHLAGLDDRLVLVGGCAIALSVTDVGHAPVRATVDVDFVTGFVSVGGYQKLESELRKRGFEPDPDGVICRFVREGRILDIMTPEEGLFGFSNPWYSEVLDSASWHALPNGSRVLLSSAPALFATKLVALQDRGSSDYASSTDLEDIVSLIDGRPELGGELETASADLRSWVAEELDTLLGQPSFTGVIPYHLPGDEASQARLPIVIERMRRMAGA